MRLNWFSPLPPARTEIAGHTARLLPALAARAEVVLWTDQADWDPALARFGPVRRYAPGRLPWAELNRGTATVYHIGNDPAFHGAIWEVSRRHPGVVVLHDLHLHHLFGGLFKQAGDFAGYEAALTRYHGPGGARAAAEFWGGRLGADFMAEHFPLTPLALENALGALVHTRPAFERLRRAGCWPVACAPLPYAPKPRPPRRPGGPPYRLVVFGYLGPNRRLPVLLQALAHFPHRDRFRLDVYGTLWDGELIRGQLRALDLTQQARLHGYVPEERLEAGLAASHLAVNLRYPTMGEASASQLRIWDHALPSLVTPDGWYATIPEDAAAFVRPDQEVADIQAHLAAFLADPARFARMGANGRRILEQWHSPAAHAGAVLDLVERLRGRARQALLGPLAERLRGSLAGWAESAAREDLGRRLAAEMHVLVA
jgi:glycosyltransferase involved in cell wall biosynthesis